MIRRVVKAVNAARVIDLSVRGITGLAAPVPVVAAVH
jgi:hypothetical protein